MESTYNIYFEKEDILKYISYVYKVNVTLVKRFINSNIQSVGSFNQTRGPWLKASGWLQGPLGLLSFRGRIK